MKPSKKFFYRKRFWFLVTLAVFLLVTHGALNTKFAQGLYFSIIEKTSGWVIDTDKLYIGLFRGKIELVNLKIISKTKRQVLTSKNIRAQVSPWSLIIGRLTFSEIFVDDFVIRVTPQEKSNEKKKNFPNLKNILGKVRNSVLIQHLYLDEVNVNSLKVVNEDEVVYSVEGVTIRSEPSLFKDTHLMINTQKMTDKSPLFDNTIVDLTLKPNSVVLHKVFVQHPYVEGTVAGSVSMEKENILDASLHGEGIPSFGTKMPFTFETHSVLDHSFLTVHAFMAHLKEATFETKGTVDILDPKYQADYSLQNGSVDHILSFFFKENLPQGKVNLKGTISGYRRSVDNQTTLQFSDFQYGPLQANAIRGVFDWKKNSMRLEAEILEGERRTAESQMQLTFKRPKEQGKLKAFIEGLTIKIQDISLEKLLPEAKMSGLATGLATGRMRQGQLHIAGTLLVRNGSLAGNSFEAKEVAFEYRPKQVTFHQMDLTTELTSFRITQPLTLSIEPQLLELKGTPIDGLDVQVTYAMVDKLLNVQKVHYHNESDNFMLKGTYAGNGQINFGVRGDFDAALLKLFKTIVTDASGPIQADLTIKGSVSQPQVTGWLKFRKTNCDFRGLAKGFEDLHGQLSISPHRLDFEKIQGNWKDGFFNVDGSVNLNNFKPTQYNLAFSAHNLTFIIPNNLRLNFDGEVTLKGNTPSPLFEGELNILEGRYFRKFKVSEIVFKPIEHEKGEESPIMEALGKYRWNINLKNAGDFRIKNNIADITFRSDLVLKGRVEKPHIEGIIISSEGEIYYLGTEFEMVDGRVEFRDPYKIRPYIVIEAQQRIRRSQIQDVYVVTVVLEGYLDNMNIKLSSNPPKTREDILSLMAFGMTRDEFKQAKSRSRSSVASTILADELSGALESSLGRAANLDIFRLEATDPDQAIISKVSVGKNITDRLSVEFSNDFLPESAERTVSSKYYLTDNFFLEGATTQRTGQENRYQFNLSLRFHVR